MKMFVKMFVIVLIAGYTSCTPVKEVSRESIGQITSVVVISPGDSNNYSLIQISTETVVLRVEGIYEPIRLNNEAVLINYSDGRQYLQWNGSRYRYYIVWLWPPLFWSKLC